MPYMVKLFLKVVFCFGLGVSVPTIVSILADFLAGRHFYKTLFSTREGALILLLCGLAALSLAIWDGQFVEDVKSTHRSNRDVNR